MRNLHLTRYLVLGLGLLFGQGCTSTLNIPGRTAYSTPDGSPPEAATVYQERTVEERELARFSSSSVLDRVRIRETRKDLIHRKLDYLVGADDVLEISIFEWELTQSTRSLLLRVSKSGMIAVPGLDPLLVAGRSVLDIQQIIVREMETAGILQKPRISVTVSEYRSRQISAIGAVNAPGVYAIRENVITLIDFLSLAGGPATDAASVAYILRPSPGGNEPLKITVDLDELFKTRRTELDAVLQAGDVVYVPIAPFVYVYGAVLQPGAIGLRKPTTFLEAIALAGGFEREADSQRVRLNRKTRGVREESIYVNVDRIESGTQQDPYLHEGDIIIVSESPSKTFARGLWEVIRSVVSVSYRLDTTPE